MNMNGYELSRRWFDFAYNKKEVKPNHTALYFFIVEHANRLGWKKEFGLPSGYAMEATGMKSYNTYIKTFNELIEFGFIKLIERSKNQYTSNIIALSNFDEALDKASDKALDKAIVCSIKKEQSTVQSTVQSTDSIIKQLNQETINHKQLEQLQSYIDKQKELLLGNKGIIDSENEFSGACMPKDEIDYKKIEDLYHKHCPSFPHIKKLTPSRKQKIKIRLKEMSNDFKVLESVFTKMEKSKFLRGDNNNGWKATFDWVFENEKNWLKIIEGNYDNKTPNNTNNVNDIWS